jgi:SAM-dependent methyltransferase
MGGDSSKGMVAAFNRKAAELGVENAKAIQVDLDKGDRLSGSFELVVSNMALHHIREIEPLLKQLWSVTAVGGYCCLSDLDTEQGDFHANPVGVYHHGFDREELRLKLLQAGFAEAEAIDAAQIIKGERVFGVFLLIARRRG